MNKKIVINVLGWALLLEAVCLLLPLICAIIYKELEMYIFAVCSAICFAVGFLFKSINPKNRSMYAKEGLASVSLSWIF